MEVDNSSSKRFSLSFKLLLLILFLTCICIYVYASLHHTKASKDALKGNDYDELVKISYRNKEQEYVCDICDYNSLEKSFAIMTPGCKILNLKPFDESIKDALKEPQVPIICNDGIPPLFESNLTHLYVIQSSLSAYNITETSKLNCCYKKFERVDPKNNKADKSFKIDKECKQINLTQSITEEFIELTCKYNGNFIYKDLFAFVPVKLKSSINNEGKLNVLVIGLDGVSRVNLQRQMPHTEAYLKKIGALEFMGYNKVGDNTFPNLISILTGHSEEEILKTCFSKNSYFDNCTFLWNLYKKAGYVTAFGEDAAWMGIFNFNRKGFQKQPTDYAYGYFNQLTERKIGNSFIDRLAQCIGSRETYRAFFNYIKMFIERMSLEKMPYFGLFWSSSLSHAYFNQLKLGDEFFKSFFEELITKYEKNTIIIFTSDHGIRWGPMQQTFQGRLEERFPFLYIKLPYWFMNKNSAAITNLYSNMYRLTTPFDLHYTLKAFLSPDNLISDNNEENEHGYSLFNDIPSHRTCEDAQVQLSWCSCEQYKEMSVEDETIRHAAQFVVEKVNEFLLSSRSYCDVLALNKILNAKQIVYHNLEDSFNFKEFILIVETEPGEGIYEANIRCEEDGFWFKCHLYSIYSLNTSGKEIVCLS